ncbi:hypothetical protein ACN28S_47445 [Cystobacter fuscus]
MLAMGAGEQEKDAPVTFVRWLRRASRMASVAWFAFNACSACSSVSRTPAGRTSGA